jgi:DNA-binding NarL/FixJ family response regulator
MTSSNERNNIIIADSQFLIVESLKIILSEIQKYTLLDTVDNFYDLKKKLNVLEADLLITDFALVDYDSIEDLKKVKQDFPSLTILILTNQINKSELLELTKSGIKNILYKTADKEEILSAVDASLKGKKYFSGDVLDMLIELNDKKNSLEEPTQLTSSEIEIVRMISEGFTTKAMAHRKNISFHTVMTHRKNIFRKLRINNSSELLMYAMKAGLIDNIEYHI